MDFTFSLPSLSTRSTVPTRCSTFSNSVLEFPWVMYNNVHLAQPTSCHIEAVHVMSRKPKVIVKVGGAGGGLVMRARAARVLYRGDVTSGQFVDILIYT